MFSPRFHLVFLFSRRRHGDVVIPAKHVPAKLVLDSDRGAGNGNPADIFEQTLYRPTENPEQVY